MMPMLLNEEWNCRTLPYGYEPELGFMVQAVRVQFDGTNWTAKLNEVLTIPLDECVAENWEKRGENYYIGRESHGCGVFRVGELWTGNVSVYNHVFNLREYPTLAEAKKECFDYWRKISKQVKG